jgi:flagellar assembly factor FliW
MQLTTTRFGEITVDETAVISFSDGIPGFEHTRKFVLVPHKTTNGQSSAFRWLQCVEEPGLALPVVNPWSVQPDYAPTIPGSVLRNMEITDVRKHAQFFAVVTVPVGSPASVTVNLLAPILINRATRSGKQEIVQNEGYSIRTPLVAPLEASQKPSQPTRRKADREMAAAAA